MERHKCADCRCSFRTLKQLRAHWTGMHNEAHTISGSGS